MQRADAARTSMGLGRPAKDLKTYMFCIARRQQQWTVNEGHMFSDIYFFK